MRNSLIIASESTNLYSTERFLIEGSRLKLAPTHLNPYEEHLSIDSKAFPKITENSKPLYLFRTTGIRFDEFDLLHATFYKSKGYLIANPLIELQTFRNKDFQHLFFKNNRLNFIPTITLRGILDEAKISSIKKISKIEEYIIKSIRGNGGIGIIKVSGLDSLISILNSQQVLKDQRYLIQPFLKNQIEYRVLISREKIFGVIEKKLKDEDFRGNMSHSSGKLIKKPASKLLEFARKILDISKLDYAGIDLFFDGESYQVIEVNAVPGFKQIEELAKTNVARELLIEFISYNK